jgi:hypothetical protein
LDGVPNAVGSFVTTNSICQGQQASEIWPVAFGRGVEIQFAHVPFKWSNLANHNAGVTVIIVGLAKKSGKSKKIYDGELVRECTVIGPYLVPNRNEFVQKITTRSADNRQCSSATCRAMAAIYSLTQTRQMS